MLTRLEPLPGSVAVGSCAQDRQANGTPIRRPTVRSQWPVIAATSLALPPSLLSRQLYRGGRTGARHLQDDVAIFCPGEMGHSSVPPRWHCFEDGLRARGRRLRHGPAPRALAFVIGLAARKGVAGIVEMHDRLPAFEVSVVPVGLHEIGRGPFIDVAQCRNLKSRFPDAQALLGLLKAAAAARSLRRHFG